MPELPEVETLSRQLRQVALGRRIEAVDIRDWKLLPSPQVEGSRIMAVERRGKALILALDCGLALRLHLRMSGRLLWQSGYLLVLPHTRMVVHFEAGWLLLVDPRRFATVSVELSRSSEIQEATDPLAQGVLAVVQRRAQERRISIKAFLMDQANLAGIGNIYACEILHAAAVDPEKRACDLPLDAWQRLESVIPPILHKAIRARGTTVSDWRDLFGQPGANQRVLKVYDRDGKPCFRCGAKVLRVKLGGRGTYFCPVCQP